MTAEPLTVEKIRKTLLEVIRARAAADQRPLSDGMLEEAARQLGIRDHHRDKGLQGCWRGGYYRSSTELVGVSSPPNFATTKIDIKSPSAAATRVLGSAVLMPERHP